MIVTLTLALFLILPALLGYALAGIRIQRHARRITGMTLERKAT